MHRPAARITRGCPGAVDWPSAVRLAWLLVRLARLCDAVEDDGALGLPVNLSDANLALWIGAGAQVSRNGPNEWRARGGGGRPHRERGRQHPGPLSQTADSPRHPRPGLAR